MISIRVPKVSAALAATIIVFALADPALAQVDPCAESGPDCRLLTAAEVSALKERLLALKAVLPVPDAARFILSKDIGPAFTMPFIAELEAGGVMISGSWPAGAFTERNDVNFVYEGAAKSEAKAKDTGDPLAAVRRMQAAFGNRIEISAALLPHAFLVLEDNGVCVDVTESSATDIEKTPAFLSYIHSDGTCLRMIFGPRTCKEEETVRVDRPARNLAPVKCITLDITAPGRDDILALKKKVDRKAFEALLGPLVR